MLLDVDHRGGEDCVDDGDEGVVGQLGHEERDEVGLAAAQGAGGRIGDVVELAGSCLNAVDRGGRDLDVSAASVEDK